MPSTWCPSAFSRAAWRPVPQAASSARRGGKAVDQPPHRRLLERHDRVARVVVGRGPDPVAGARVGLDRQLGCLACMVAVQDRSYLAQTRGGLLVGSVIEGAQQRQPLGADQQFAEPDVALHGRERNSRRDAQPACRLPRLRLHRSGVMRISVPHAALNSTHPPAHRCCYTAQGTGRPTDESGVVTTGPAGLETIAVRSASASIRRSTPAATTSVSPARATDVSAATRASQRLQQTTSSDLLTVDDVHRRPADRLTASRSSQTDSSAAPVEGAVSERMIALRSSRGSGGVDGGHQGHAAHCGCLDNGQVACLSYWMRPLHCARAAPVRVRGPRQYTTDPDRRTSPEELAASGQNGRYRSTRRKRCG